MAHAVTDPAAWRLWEDTRAYRFVSAKASYLPEQPWPTDGGRFDDGRRATLYVAGSPEAAVAEFLRKHPEYISRQDRLDLRVFEMELKTVSEGLDVRTEDQANAIGFPYVRLRSNEADPAARYAECRRLAQDVDRAGGIGIAYSSAAYQAEFNFCTFHEAEAATWMVDGVREIDVPTVEASKIRVLDR